MLKKCLSVILTAALVLALGACSGNSDDNKTSDVGIPGGDSSEESSETVRKPSGSGISYLVDSEDTPSASASSLTMPLEIGDWGTAAKLSLENGGYVDVPVRVVSFRRSGGVNNEVKKIMDGSAFNYYFEPSENEEYVLVDYEICLNGFPVGQGGITCDIPAFVTGDDGEFIKLENGSYFGTSASCLDNETYYFEGIVHSEMAYRVPKEVTEYMLTIGEYGENQVFVKIK